METATTIRRPDPSEPQQQQAGYKGKAQTNRKKGLENGPVPARTPANDPVMKGSKTGKAGKAKDKKKAGENGEGKSSSSFSSSAPPPTSLPTNDKWTDVVKKGDSKRTNATAGGSTEKAVRDPKNSAKGSAGASAGRAPTAGKQQTANARGEPTSSKKRRIRPPRTAAVVVTPPQSGGLTLAETMAEARRRVKLSDIGITHLRPKVAATGAMILEIPGENSVAKADLLATRLKEVLEEKGVKIHRPTKSEELRVSGLEDSVTSKEVAEAIAEAGGCKDIEVKVGGIRKAPSGLGAVWVQCPAAAAKKLAAVGRVMVGWVSARIEVLTPRPMHCYRCLEKGHTRRRCTAPTDRGDRCYRCGQLGHTAGLCNGTPQCPLCKDLGRPASHRLGSKACAPA